MVNGDLVENVEAWIAAQRAIHKASIVSYKLAGGLKLGIVTHSSLGQEPLYEMTTSNECQCLSKYHCIANKISWFQTPAIVIAELRV